MENDLDNALNENKNNVSLGASNTDNKAVENFLSQMKGFEEDRVELAKQSAIKAWKVAGGFGVIALMAVGAVVVMMPLKHVEPYLLKVDSVTGDTSVVKPLSDAKGDTYGEVLDKFFLNRFIIERNGYEWETIQNSYNIVKLMSNSKVFNAYSSYITGDTSPTKLFADNHVIRITVQGLTFLPATSTEQSLAQIRFTRRVENNDGIASTKYKPTLWTATVTYDYRASIKTEDERLLNPLNFRITSYREDRSIN